MEVGRTLGKESNTGNHEGEIQGQDTVKYVTNSSNLYQPGSYTRLSRVEGVLVGKGQVRLDFVVTAIRPIAID